MVNMNSCNGARASVQLLANNTWTVCHTCLLSRIKCLAMLNLATCFVLWDYIVSHALVIFGNLSKTTWLTNRLRLRLKQCLGIGVLQFISLRTILPFCLHNGCLLHLYILLFWWFCGCFELLPATLCFLVGWFSLWGLFYRCLFISFLVLWLEFWCDWWFLWLLLNNFECR